jgi:hypothetical protein
MRGSYLDRPQRFHIEPTAAMTQTLAAGLVDVPLNEGNLDFPIEGGAREFTPVIAQQA